jgi:hypothetical protein
VSPDLGPRECLRRPQKKRASSPIRTRKADLLRLKQLSCAILPTPANDQASFLAREAHGYAETYPRAINPKGGAKLALLSGYVEQCAQRPVQPRSLVRPRLRDIRGVIWGFVGTTSRARGQYQDPAGQLSPQVEWAASWQTEKGSGLGGLHWTRVDRSELEPV